MLMEYQYPQHREDASGKSTSSLLRELKRLRKDDDFKKDYYPAWNSAITAIGRELMKRGEEI